MELNHNNRLLFNMDEFLELKNAYGNRAVINPVTIEYSNLTFFNEFKNKVGVERRGEVAFFVQRENGRFVLVRVWDYPQKIYRVPTGGINLDEKVIDALKREIKEELGLRTEIKKFLGAIDYTISHKDEHIKFYSYVFWLKDIGGNILDDASENEISSYKEVNKVQMEQMVNMLEHYRGPWKDWCMFRLQTTGFILPYILNR